ncbi:hypothetical protein Aperf_G00000061630 [Anoplocephala perfoliata]
MMNLPPLYLWLRSRFLHQSRQRHQIFILFLTFSVYVLFHSSRKPLSVVKTVFHKKCSPQPPLPPNYCQWKPFDTDNWAAIVGWLEIIFLLFYAFAMFPIGHAAERISLRVFLTGGMVASGLTTVMFGLGYYLNIHALSYYVAAQILGGITQATGWPCVVTILSNWFGRGRRGLIMGIWNAHTNVGNVLGSILAGAFVNYQWGASFLVPGFLLIAGAYVVYLVLVDHPIPELDLSPSSTSDADGHDKSHLLYYGDVKAISDIGYKEQPILFWDAIRLPNVFPYAMALFFSKLVSYTFLYWLPNYLSNVSTEVLSAEKAAWLSTIFDLGGICGGIIAGLLSDSNTPYDHLTTTSLQDSSLRTIYLRAVTCASMLAIAAPCLLYYQSIAASMSFRSMVILFICGGLVTGPCALITTAVSADLGTQPSIQGNSKALATVTAIIDGTGSIGASLGPFLTAYLVSYGWQAVFMMLVFADVIAMLITVFISYRSRNPGGAVYGSNVFNLRSHFML